MGDTITLNIDEKLKNALEEECRIKGKDRQEYILDAIRRTIIIDKFDAARKVLVPKARAAGYLTDEDFFNNIS